MNRRRIPTEKLNKEELQKQLKKIWSYLKKYKFLLISSLILSIIGSILTIIGPNQLTKITDKIVEGLTIGINLKHITKITIFLLTIYILSSIFSYLKDIIMAVITQNITKKLRKELIDKLNKLPLKYFDTYQTGDILSRISNDIDIISQSLNQTIGGLTSAITTLIGVIIIMFITNLYMTITAIITSIIGFILIILIMKRSQKYFVKQQIELGNLNSHIEEMYSSHNIVKTYNGETESKRKFDNLNNKLFENSHKSQFLSSLMPPIMNFIGNFNYVAICIVGSYLVMTNKITFGVIIAYMLYVRLFSNPLNTIAQSFNNIQLIAASSKRVFDFLDEEELEEELNKKKQNKIIGNINFKNVKFGYTNKLVIKKFTANIKAGSKIAIVGPTGAGKTTIVNLLMRFYELNSGEIIIDDINIKDLKREDVYDLFCMVLQDTWIFEGSIKENIKFNSKNITDEKIFKITKSIEIDHLIRSFPNGYDTILTDSETLSSGEKQLITIARAMLKDSPFLILDEATSNVDVRTEKIVQNAMDKLMKNKTSFIIAHRLSTIKNADLILVLKDGNIVEQGNHQELLNKQGYYYELYNSQFQK